MKPTDNTPSQFAEIMQVFEEVNGATERLNIRVNHQGRVVVEAVSSGSSGNWLESDNSEVNKAKQLLLDEAYKVLNSKGKSLKGRLVKHIKGKKSKDKSLKNRLINQIKDKKFPLDSLNRNNQNNFENILSENNNNRIKATDLKTQAGYSGNHPAPIKINTFDEVSVDNEVEPVKSELITHSPLAKEVAFKTAHNELTRLESKMPSVSVQDTLNYMRARQSYLLQEPSMATVEPFRRFDQRLEQHFDDTRQRPWYDSSCIEITASLLEQFEDKQPGAFNLIKKGYQTEPLQYPYIERYLSDLERRTFNRNPMTGGHRDRISRKDLEMAITFNEGKEKTDKHYFLVSDIYQNIGKVITSIFSNTLYRSINEEITALDVEKLQKSINRVDELWNKLGKLDSNAKSSREKKKSKRDDILRKIEPDLQLIASGRQLLHLMNSTLGRRLSKDYLRDIPGNRSMSEVYKKLEKIESLRGPVLHDAQLQHLIRLHDEKPVHPKVVIEGAGPIGLLSAIRQYEQGADVMVIEKRDTLYNRSQIVRLDSLWINDLRYYLGDEFDQMFAPEKVKQQADGYATIKISDLEDALHLRLSKLISLDPHKPPRIQRLAEHRIVDVSPPEKKGQRYRVKTESVQRSSMDSAPQEQYFEADLLICAGGKNSPTRKQFLNHSPWTESKTYGVASWEDYRIKNDQLNTFPDFRDILVTDPKFSERFNRYINENLHPFTAAAAIELSPQAHKELTCALGLTKGELESLLMDIEDDQKAFLKEVIADIASGRLDQKKPVQDMLTNISQEVCQLRTFEQRNLIYLGMEIPETAYQWITTVGQQLPDHERKFIQQTLTQCWFQGAADMQGFSNKVGADIEVMNTRFTDMFPVAQENNDDHFMTINNTDGGTPLTVVPAGDAGTSPHFMTASGLTGGREMVDALCSFTAGIVKDKGSAINKLKSDLLISYRGISEFILDNGHNFLNKKEPYEITETLKAEQRKEFKMWLDGKGASNGYLYNKEKSANHSFEVKNHQLNHEFRVSIGDNGDLLVATSKSINRFKTVRHFELEFLRM